MTTDDILKAILQHVKDNPRCRLPRNMENLPESFDGVDEKLFWNCLHKAFLDDHYIKGTRTSAGYSYLEITDAGEQLLT